MVTGPTLPETGFVRLPVLQQFFPISKAEWYEGVKDGRYPAPVRLAPRVVAWRVEDIRALIERVSSTGTVFGEGAAQ